MNGKEWMERFIIYVYTKDSRIENARQSMKPYAESDSLPPLLRKGCFRNQLIKINVVVTQVILDFCKMELIQGEMPWKKYTHSAFRIRIDKAYVGA